MNIYLGKRFTEAREAKGLSQEAIAKLSGVSQQTISKIEKGIREIPRGIKKYADILGVEPEWLLFGKDGNNISPNTRKSPKNHIPILSWEEIISWCVNDEDLDMSHRRFISSPTPDALNNHLFAVIVENETMTTNSGATLSFPVGTILIADPDLEWDSGAFIIGYWMNSKKPIFRQYIDEGIKEYIRPLNSQSSMEEISEKFIHLARVIERRDILMPQKAQ